MGNFNELYRGFPSILGGGNSPNFGNSWNNINQILVSDAATPDVIKRTLNTNIPGGTLGLTWDGQFLWAVSHGDPLMGCSLTSPVCTFPSTPVDL